MSELESCSKLEKLNKLTSNDRPTEEEFDNFMHKVVEVEKAVKKLASTDIEEQEQGKLLADEILQKGDASKEANINEDEVKIKTNRTVINKYTSESDDNDPERQSKGAFMKSIEKDAKQRAEDRKRRNERADTYKHIGNEAFKRQDFEKAVTYFTKALEQRKDSSMLWNNRALAYTKLGLYEKALKDCEWALKVHDTNLKAFLISAKCHKCLGNEEQFLEFLQNAQEFHPSYQQFIDDYKEEIIAAARKESI